MDNTDLAARIAALKLMIDAYEAAILALVSGGVSEYRLNTGQTDQRVTKLDLAGLNTTYQSLMNMCVTLEARLTGGNTNIMRPCF